MNRKEELVAMKVDVRFLEVLTNQIEDAEEEIRSKYSLGEGGDVHDVMAELRIQIERLTNEFNTSL